jgi:hypothetical protein
MRMQLFLTIVLFAVAILCFTARRMLDKAGV